MYNSSTILGIFTEPFYGQTKSGSSYCQFTLETKEKYGEKEIRNFIPVVCYGKLSDSLKQHCKEGNELLVIGRINTFEKDSNQKFEVVSEKIRFL